MKANVLCKTPKNAYTYRDGIQAIFVCVIMVDYNPLLVCVIIFISYQTDVYNNEYYLVPSPQRCFL